jgi:hypothetical protein
MLISSMIGEPDFCHVLIAIWALHFAAHPFDVILFYDREGRQRFEAIRAALGKPWDRIVEHDTAAFAQRAIEHHVGYIAHRNLLAPELIVVASQIAHGALY